MRGAAHSQPSPLPWLIGMGTLTFGLVAGFVVTALPFLLSKAGVSLDRIATVVAIAMSPTFWAFLLTPIVDVCFTRRTYSFALAIASATSLGAALCYFSPGRLWLFTTLVLFAELTVVLQNNAVNGWISEFVPDSERGKVGGWVNVANLGGGALGAMLIMWSASWFTFRTLGATIAFAILVSTLFLLRFPKPAIPQIRLLQIFGGTFRSVIQTSRQPQVLTGFLLFLAPASCVAAINLFAGLGPEFHTSQQWVVWITGAGAALTSATGSILGGYVADRVDRGVLYMGGGLLAGLCALLLALTPHTQAAFIAGVLAYTFIAGVCYAAFTALGLQLVGIRNPTAATQLGLFAAAANCAVVYMTWMDGQGFRMFDTRGLLLVDGLAAVGAAIPLLVFLRSRRMKASLALHTREVLSEEV
jgi:MFS transporter, PAT family, beta-lactamase induction signal transducer AmpG